MEHSSCNSSRQSNFKIITIEHKSYYYRVSDSLSIMICGMLSSLQNISDIYDWAQEEPVQDFLYDQFGIYKIPSRAQLYNLIGCVKSEKFAEVFVEWVSEIVQSENKGNTAHLNYAVLPYLFHNNCLKI